MPISKEKMKLYPGGGIRSPEWLAIRARIRLRAHDLCEGCGIPNGLYIWRMPDPETGLDPYVVASDKDARLMGRAPTQIVCTVAHIDDDLVDHSDGNLAFWCQQCHNRHDAKGRAARRKGKFQ
jgi:hypothetical protein